jgi:hypothetical protein
MKSGSKLTTSDAYDRVISAKIPDKDKFPELHDLVVSHMLHGPCGNLNKYCPYMVKGQCRFPFPREFCEATRQGNDSYPTYRRRDDGHRVKLRRAELDNRWVVPYNPSLLFRYNCHINVEACASIKAIKYLFKYVYKGHDQAEFVVNADQNDTDDGVINEIKQYRNARFITPPEAVYRIFGFPIFRVYPSVLQLQLHLPGMQTVTYNDDDNLEDVVNRPGSDRTTLTEYFKKKPRRPVSKENIVQRFSRTLSVDEREKDMANKETSISTSWSDCLC